jgi:hypothetical protein
MRDWLSCPLSPATSVHTKSDEGATTDDEYAFINPESSSELDLTEEEGEETSSWLSVLSIFGVSKKLSRKKSGSSSSSSSLNTTMPIEGASNEKESKSEYPEKKSMEANEEHEDEGVHLYQMPMDESCSNSIVSTIESDHHIFTPVSSSLPVDSLSKIPPKCLETHLVKVTKVNKPVHS